MAGEPHILLVDGERDIRDPLAACLGRNGLRVSKVAVREEDDRLAIEVSDDGSGIPVGELTKVQESFYRIEPSRRRETGGSGLGLTPARAAARAHDGRLELENRAGGGPSARIPLPRAAA